MGRRKRSIPATQWLPDQADVISPDHKHVYAQTRQWDPQLPVLRWVLLHPLPNTTQLDRCIKIAKGSGFGGISVRYLFTLITSNQEELVDAREVNGPHATSYLSSFLPSTSQPEQNPVMAAWKLRGGTHELRQVVGARVAGLAETAVQMYTPDTGGRSVLSPTQFPINLRVDGYQPLRYTSERAASYRPPAPRILLTGSRAWQDGTSIRATLAWAWSLFGLDPEAVLIEGECPHGGADTAGREAWEAFGLPVEKHPADIDDNGQVQGPSRNARMVASGAQLCMSYPNSGSRGGTRNCCEQAAEAGIPIVSVREWIART